MTESAESRPLSTPTATAGQSSYQTSAAAAPRGQRWWRLVLPLLVVIPLVALLAYGFRRDPRAIPSPLVGRPAPLFALPLFDSGTFSLADYQGQVVVVNFWASWCYPACWNEAPRLEAAWQQYREQGVMVVGVDIQDTEQNARAFIARFQQTFPQGPDSAQGKIAIDYGVYGVPETFFIGRDGVIAYKHVGEIDTATLTGWIERLLGQRE